MLIPLSDMLTPSLRASGRGSEVADTAEYPSVRSLKLMPLQCMGMTTSVEATDDRVDFAHTRKLLRLPH